MAAQHDLRKLSADLRGVTLRIPSEVRGVVKKGAQNIKDEARSNASRHPSWRHIAGSINYDLAGNAFFSRAQVGYNHSGQGKLAGIYEFGSARRGPNPTLMPAFEAEKARFEGEMGKAVDRLLKGLS